MDKIFSGALCAVLLTAACSSQRPATVKDVALGLAQHGVAYERTLPLRLPEGQHFRFDEGAVLTADGLWVEIIRIEDTKIFTLAESASALLTISEAAAGRPFPGKPQVYARQPYIIVVRQEPREGQVRSALDRVLPASR